MELEADQNMNGVEIEEIQALYNVKRLAGVKGRSDALIFFVLLLGIEENELTETIS